MNPTRVAGPVGRYLSWSEREEIAALDLGPGSARIADLERHGLVVTGPAGLRATPDGRHLLDGVIRTLIV